MAEEAGRRIDREEKQRGRGSGRVAAVPSGSGGGSRVGVDSGDDEIEIEMEADTADAGASSSGQQHDADDGLQRSTWKRFLTHTGPGFLISLAYLDPSNVQNDLQAGSSHKYELLWVLFFGFIFVLIIQSLAVKLGIITGRHLAELCMGEYPKNVKYCLWFLAEVGVIAATIPGVLGTALAYNMLLHIPFRVGVLICGASTLLLLALQIYGARKIELIGVIFMLVMAACFSVELSKANPPISEVIEGLFVPRLSVKDASTFFLIENGIALLLVLLVNIAIVSIPGTVCVDSRSVDDVNACNGLSLNSTYVLLKNLFGKSSSTLYGLALLTSGQSCTMATSYSGQYIMQGFSGMTKCIIYIVAPFFTIVPSLIICAICGAHRVRRLINIAAFVLAFVLPFALVPLLKFSSCCVIIGPYKKSRCIVRISWVLSTIIFGINIYFFCTTFVDWIVHNELPRVANAIFSTLIFPFMAAYIASVIYLVSRKVNIARPIPSMSTSCEPTEDEEVQKEDDMVHSFSVHQHFQNINKEHA
ncbi:hypothetical protein ACP70R_033742 [Stipagrostis hirtigluma subsp. patula]